MGRRVSSSSSPILECRLLLLFWQDHLIEGETIYIASDETDRSLFGVFKERFRVRFLEDYYEEAKVSEMNPNYIGMMEQVHTVHSLGDGGLQYGSHVRYIGTTCKVDDRNDITLVVALQEHRPLPMKLAWDMRVAVDCEAVACRR